MTHTRTPARTSKELFGVHHMPFVALAETSVDQCVMLLDVDGRIVFSPGNPHNATLWSSTHTEGTHLRIVYPEGGAEDGTAEAHLGVATAAGAYAGKGTRIRADGSRFAAAVSILSIHDDAGTLLGFAHLMRDTTSETEQQADLLRERELIAAMMDNLADGVVACDVSGRLTHFNHAAQVLHGMPAEPIPPEEAAARYELFRADGVTRMRTEDVPLFRALRDEKVCDVEMVIAPRGRPPCTVLANGQALITPSGERIGAVVTMHDITERKRAEVALRAREEQVRQLSDARLRLVMESITDYGIMTMDNEGRVLTMNTAAERATGYPREELIGQHFSVLYLATDQDEAEREISEARGQGRAAREGWRLRKDGSLYWDEEVMTALRSGDLPVEFVKITHDATERHHAMQALRAAEERFRLALRATNEVIFDHDFLADLTIWGDAMLPVFGYEDVSFKVGRAWWFEHVHPDDRDAVRRDLAAAAASGADVWTGAYRFRRADGEYARILSRAYLARDAAGQTIRLVGSMADVTREERAERELRIAKEKAEAANRAKSDFLAVMSHELRTPLHAVIGFANILRRKAAPRLEPAHAKAVERIRDNGINLLSLIDGILHLAKVESGKIEVECRPVALGLMLRQTADQLSSAGVVPIVVEVPEGPMAALDTDEGMLRQVLVNLIGNALRFTTIGQVTIRAVVDPESRRAVRIDVADTGPGIPDERQAAIFEVFEQADNSSTRAHGGTGMGLAISRALCQALGYRLELASEVGRGSIFSIVLQRPGGEPRPVSPTPA